MWMWWTTDDDLQVPLHSQVLGKNQYDGRVPKASRSEKNLPSFWKDWIEMTWLWMYQSKSEWSLNGYIQWVMFLLMSTQRWWSASTRPWLTVFTPNLCIAVSDGCLCRKSLRVSQVKHSPVPIYALLISDICWRHLSVFGHIARLTQGTPAHNALHWQVGLASGRSLGTDCRRRPGRPHARGTDNFVTTPDLFLPTSGDRQAILRGHGGAKRWPDLSTRWRRRRYLIQGPQPDTSWSCKTTDMGPGCCTVAHLPPSFRVCNLYCLVTTCRELLSDSDPAGSLVPFLFTTRPPV